MIPPHLQSDRTFIYGIPHRRTGSRGQLLKKRDIVMTVVRPVNGETHFNDVGLSHGIVHLAHPETGEKLGWCGVCRFDKDAIPVISRTP